jgi:hypothetical protein
MEDNIKVELKDIGTRLSEFIWFSRLLGTWQL